MGKGTIISHIADGQYSVTVNYDSTEIDVQLAVLQNHETLLIAAIAAEEDDTKKKLLRVQLLSVQKRIEYLNDTDNVPVDDNITAWCADLTTDLTGEVGLIEIGRERVNGVNIQPGYESNAVYDGERDGILTPLMAQDAAATFYNLAMLPGTQKWKPTYLYGVISNIDTDLDTADVTLDALNSSQQALGIVQDMAYVLTDVPVVYMECNSYAFEEGDRVLVHFKGYDFEQPEVIGFEEEPKPCATKFMIKVNQDYVGILGWPMETEEAYEYVRIDIEDTDGNYYGSVSRYPDDDEIYWTLNGRIWENRPYIEEEGEPYQNKVCASFDLDKKQWTIFYDNWGWSGEGEDEVYGPLPAPENPDAKYFITVLCQDCPNATQYPYRYKDDDKGNVEDAVAVGEFVVVVPFFKTSVLPQGPVDWETFYPTALEQETPCFYLNRTLAGYSFIPRYINPYTGKYVNGSYYDHFREEPYTYSIHVVSSIPYNLYEKSELETYRPVTLVKTDPLPDSPSTTYWVGYVWETDRIFPGDSWCSSTWWTQPSAITPQIRVGAVVTGEFLSVELDPAADGIDEGRYESRPATGSGGIDHVISIVFTPIESGIPVTFGYRIDGFYHFVDFSENPVNGFSSSRSPARIATNSASPILT